MMLMGVAQVQAGHAEEAEQSLLASVRKHNVSRMPSKTTLEGWANLGKFYFEKGNLYEAEKAFKTALLIHPNQYAAMKNLGVTLFAERMEEGFRKSKGFGC